MSLLGRAVAALVLFVAITGPLTAIQQVAFLAIADANLAVQFRTQFDLLCPSAESFVPPR